MRVTRQEYKRAGVAFFGELGRWAYAAFDELNLLCFAGRLAPRAILWGLTPHGKAIGHYSPRTGAITLHTALLDPKGDPWSKRSLMGERYARDVLVHEMTHASQAELLGQTGFGGDETHNCATWCREIVRVTPLLGLPPIVAEPIRQKRVGGKVTWYVPPGHLSRAEIARWPHTIRPDGYYERAVRELADRAV